VALQASRITNAEAAATEVQAADFGGNIAQVGGGAMNFAAEAEAQRSLNAVTSALQSGRLSNAEAAARFTEMIPSLPEGKLRCSALLNRAHCAVALGEHTSALGDIDAILATRAADFDPSSWHKVWMSRGAIHRKLAQQSGDPSHYTKARADYEHVLGILPEHAEYVAKARRCLDQLDPLQQRSSPGKRRSSTSGPGVGADTFVTGAPGGARSGSSSQDSDGVKRPRLRLRQKSHELLVEARGADAHATEAVCGAIDANFAQRSLAELGRDCAAAGRALFSEGAVQERRGDGATDAAAAPPRLARGDASSPPQSSCRRIFEIKSPLGGPAEVVVLDAAGGAGASAGIGGSGFVAGGGPRNRVGACTCRLRGDCKHVAAALCAVARQAIAPEGMALGAPTCGDGGGAGGAQVVFLPAMPWRELEQIERRLEKRTVDELKHLLRLNCQLVGGTKAELLRRVSDGIANGALPPCPRCGGHLHPEAGGRFSCHKLNRDRESCGYEARGDEIERKPFKGADQLV